MSAGEAALETLAQTLYETWTRPRPGVVAFHDEGPAPPWETCGASIKKSWRELAGVALAAQAAQTRPWDDHLAANLNAALSENAALREALRHYGVHFAPCRYGGTTARVGPQDDCSCGLRAALTGAPREPHA